MSRMGPIALFGSGETAPRVQRIHRRAMEQLSLPVRAAIVETPAGFEPNSEAVARKIADYLEHRLRNFQPQVTLVPARRRATAFDPDDPAIAAPLFLANYLFMGPGSPTYAVRQLRESFTWHALQWQHRQGAALCFSSASTLAISRYTIPVYEIYKVGEDLHWKDGLDFFGAFGLQMVIVPHWNNSDGGAELDTSHCYIGTARYDRLVAMLPEKGVTILGIDENTGLVIRPDEAICEVIGAGDVTVIRDGNVQQFRASCEFPAHELGDWRLPPLGVGIPQSVVAAAKAAAAEEAARQAALDRAKEAREQNIPDDLRQLAHRREEARQQRDWQKADQIRDQIFDRGWQIIDTPEGPVLEPAK